MPIVKAVSPFLCATLYVHVYLHIVEHPEFLYNLPPIYMHINYMTTYTRSYLSVGICIASGGMYAGTAANPGQRTPKEIGCDMEKFYILLHIIRNILVHICMYINNNITMRCGGVLAVGLRGVERG